VPPAPADLTDRRVEITGPTDRKMAVNALNSGARVWLADLEDANTPHWANVVGGQVNLYDAVRATIGYDAPDGRRYRLGDGPYPTIVMRPRGWHLDERHVTTAGGAACGALVDAGLFLYHNAAELLARGSGPYLYLPKMESHREAELWRDVFAHAERTLGVPEGSVRATALIETIPAAVAMTVPFLRAYTRLLVATCHRRGAYAIGGMAAFVPSRRDPAASSPCPPTT
jgi:malate synthase